MTVREPPRCVVAHISTMCNAVQQRPLGVNVKLVRFNHDGDLNLSLHLKL